MAGFVDNFELGLAGAEDFFSKFSGHDSHYAADTYAKQTAQDQGLDQGETDKLVAAAEAADDNEGRLGVAGEAAARLPASLLKAGTEAAVPAISKTLWIVGGVLVLTVAAAVALAFSPAAKVAAKAAA